MKIDWNLEDSLKSFGRRVAFLRKTRGWSQERLALESGLARSYLGGIERGSRNLSLLNIIKLAVTLNVPVSELFPNPDPHMESFLVSVQNPHDNQNSSADISVD